MLLGVVVVVLVGFTGYQALKAKTALEQVAADFDTLRAQLAGGDESGARSTLAAAQRHASDAADSTRGPGWWLSADLPQIGPNVRAVRSVALVADGLATDVLPDVVDASATLSPQRLKPVNGRIDLDPIRASAPSVERAASRLASESDRVDGIDAAPLAPQIAAPVRQLQTKIADAAGAGRPGLARRTPAPGHAGRLRPPSLPVPVPEQRRDPGHRRHPRVVRLPDGARRQADARAAGRLEHHQPPSRSRRPRSPRRRRRSSGRPSAGSSRT